MGFLSSLPGMALGIGSAFLPPPFNLIGMAAGSGLTSLGQGQGLLRSLGNAGLTAGIGHFSGGGQDPLGEGGLGVSPQGGTQADRFLTDVPNLGIPSVSNSDDLIGNLAMREAMRQPAGLGFGSGLSLFGSGLGPGLGSNFGQGGFF